MTTTKASAFLWESALAMALHNNYYTDFKGARIIMYELQSTCSFEVCIIISNNCNDKLMTDVAFSAAILK